MDPLAGASCLYQEKRLHPAQIFVSRWSQTLWSAPCRTGTLARLESILYDESTRLRFVLLTKKMFAPRANFRITRDSDTLECSDLSELSFYTRAGR